MLAHKPHQRARMSRAMERYTYSPAFWNGDAAAVDWPATSIDTSGPGVVAMLGNLATGKQDMRIAAGRCVPEAQAELAPTPSRSHMYSHAYCRREHSNYYDVKPEQSTSTHKRAFWVYLRCTSTVHRVKTARKLNDIPRDTYCRET